MLERVAHEYLDVVAQRFRKMVQFSRPDINRSVGGETDSLAQACLRVMDHRPRVLEVINGLGLDLLCQKDLRLGGEPNAVPLVDRVKAGLRELEIGFGCAAARISRGEDVSNPSRLRTRRPGWRD